MKMETSSKKGVFYPSLDSEKMIHCLQSLYNDHPSIIFLSIVSDEDLIGFRITFSEPDVSTVLRKNNRLSTYDSVDVDIFPLTTYLLIKGINHNQNKDRHFERDMRDDINKTFGKVLRILKFDSEPSLKDCWRVEIDIPEYKELPAFQSDSFSKMAVLNEEFKVEFWCRHCRESGHFQSECNLSSEREVSNIKLEPPEKFAEKIGMEEISKISNWIQNSYEDYKKRAESEKTESKKLKTEKEVKKERPDTSEKNSNGKKKSKISEYYKVTEKVSRSKNEEKTDQSDGAASDSDDVQVLCVKGKDEETNFNDVSRSSSDDRSGDFPTPSTSATTDLPSTVPSDNRDVRSTEVLSTRLQKIIDFAYEEVKVVNRFKLDAFLSHVKKKVNPIAVAKNYTSDTKRFKKQLKKILEIYYDTPLTGTKEDLEFIKKLEKIVDRFDKNEGSTTRKRKSTDKNTDDDKDDPPYKK